MFQSCSYSRLSRASFPTVKVLSIWCTGGICLVSQLSALSSLLLTLWLWHFVSLAVCLFVCYINNIVLERTTTKGILSCGFDSKPQQQHTIDATELGAWWRKFGQPASTCETFRLRSWSVEFLHTGNVSVQSAWSMQFRLTHDVQTTGSWLSIGSVRRFSWQLQVFTTYFFQFGTKPFVKISYVMFLLSTTQNGLDGNPTAQTTSWPSSSCSRSQGNTFLLVVCFDILDDNKEQPWYVTIYPFSNTSNSDELE